MSPEICDLNLGACDLELCDLSLKAFPTDHIKPDHIIIPESKSLAIFCTSGMRGNIAYDRKCRHPGKNMDLDICDLELCDLVFGLPARGSTAKGTNRGPDHIETGHLAPDPTHVNGHTGADINSFRFRLGPK